MLGNGPHVLGNEPHMLGNGLHVLGKSTLGITRTYVIQDYVTSGIMSFRIMLHLVLCCLGLCRIRGYVVWDYIAFGIMLRSVFHHSRLCRSC